MWVIWPVKLNVAGDLRTLSKATSEGNETELLTCNLRCDSIKATHWPQLISEYVLKPENSRAVNGQEMIVRYGVKRSKYLLLHSKRNIALAFKGQHPDYPFSTSTLIREFPQNAVTPTTRDLERNTCPTHANARRMIKALHSAVCSAGIAKDISHSCRQMVHASMCQPSISDPIDPLTWNQACVHDTCKKCPLLQI